MNRSIYNKSSLRLWLSDQPARLPGQTSQDPFQSTLWATSLYQKLNGIEEEKVQITNGPMEPTNVYVKKAESFYSCLYNVNISRLLNLRLATPN
ncbi:hypothetical protein ACTXT7_013478 [Hymenolepis weldensis]